MSAVEHFIEIDMSKLSSVEVTQNDRAQIMDGWNDIIIRVWHSAGGFVYSKKYRKEKKKKYDTNAWM